MEAHKCSAQHLQVHSTATAQHRVVLHTELFCAPCAFEAAADSRWRKRSGLYARHRIEQGRTHNKRHEQNVQRIAQVRFAHVAHTCRPDGTGAG